MWFNKKGAKPKPKKKKTPSRRLDVKARRRVVWYHRLSIIGRSVALLFSAAVLLWAGWRGVHLAVDVFLLENQAFALKRFKLETNGRLTADQVLKWAGVDSGDNVLDLDLAQIKRNLEMVPMIYDVAVERVLPDRLKVRIRERRPVFKAYFLSPGRANSRIVMKPYMIDEFGFVLSPQAAEGVDLDHQEYWLQLPELTGLTGLGLVPGKLAKSRQVDYAIKTYLAFRNSSMNDRVKIRSIDISRPRILLARTSDQQEVVLGRDDLVAQFRRWEMMLDEAHRKEMRLISLDLSMKNNHPFKWIQKARDLPQEQREPQIVRRTET
ncbi:FtsQ-type POTRA domain-containing protein [bacterium]|jgi:cell division septal protein FtsQ|nr:FtsQ-type POTRA domain-containing protein [bacterium]MDB4796681.1 FtsQ-type POTRA domain-containing protein [bacterium]